MKRDLACQWKLHTKCYGYCVYFKLKSSLFVEVNDLWQEAVSKKTITELTESLWWVAQGNFPPTLSQNRTWTSRLIQLPSSIRRANLAVLSYSPAPPISGWPNNKIRWSNPFAPFPLQELQHYYELVRPCDPHRYSHSCGSSTWISPLASERQVPTLHMKVWIKFTPPSYRKPFSL